MLEGLEMIDFDGDGKRDIGAWFPPVNATDLGRFRVFTSSSGFATQWTQQLGHLGDTPVVADYNGDGITDYAVVEEGDGFVGVGGTPGAGQKAWRYCLSTPGSPATHDCSHASVAHQWGEFGDIPIVGTRFSTSSPGEFTVYRPSDSTLYTAVPYAGWTSRPLGMTAAERGQAPYVASFDTHGGSDIAFFDACYPFYRPKPFRGHGRTDQNRWRYLLLGEAGYLGQDEDKKKGL